MDLFREKHTPQTEYGPSQKVRKALGETHSPECGPSQKVRKAYFIIFNVIVNGIVFLISLIVHC